MRDLEKALTSRLQLNSEVQSHTKEFLILGIGNYLMGDEGAGVHCIHDIISRKLRITNTDIIDGGVGGFSLLGYFEEYKKIIIIDATMDGKPPGTITIIKPKFASDFPSALSAHDFGLKDLVESLYLLDKRPEIYLFTISINNITPMSVELSEDVKAAIPITIEKVISFIEDTRSQKG